MVFEDQSISEIQGSLPITGGAGNVAQKVDTSAATQGYIQGATQLGGALLEVFAQSQKDKATSGMATFIERQVSLADAVDQGTMGSRDARMRMRKNLAEFISANPSYAQDLIDIQKDIIGTTGLGKIVDEGTQEENLREQAISDASKAGFIPVNATEGEIDEGVARYQDLQGSLTKLNAISKNLEVSGKMNELTRNRLADSATAELRNIAITGLENTRAEFNGMLKTYTGSVEDKQAMVDWIASTRANVSAQMKLLPGAEYVDENVGENILSGYLGFLDYLEERVSGGKNLQLLKTELEKISTSSQLQMMQNSPELQRVVALSTLVGDNSGIIALKKDKVIVDALNGAFLPNPKSAGVVGDITDLDREDRQDSFQTFDNIMKGIDQGKAVNFDEAEVQTAISSYLNNTFKALGDPKAIADNPEMFSDVLGFMAKQSFLTAMQNYKGGITPELQASAEESLMTMWNDEIIPLIKEEFKNKKQVIVSINQKFGVNDDARIQAVISRGDVIEPVWRNGGVTFIPLAGGEFSAHENVRRTINELNADVAPILTTMVKAQAHLEGNNDYLGQWENIQRNAFPLRDLKEVQVESMKAEPAKPITQTDFLYNEPIDLQDMLRNGKVELDIEQLMKVEGVGDSLTSNATGVGGLQVSEKRRLERKMGKGLSDKQAIKLHLEEGNAMYSQNLPGYNNAPVEVKNALLDSGYNMGYSTVLSFDGMKDALARGDYEGTVANLLDTANVEGKSVKGVAKRRAYWYNQVSPNKIVEVEQEKDGTINYYDKDGVNIYSYKPSGGKHPKSRAGKVKL